MLHKNFLLFLLLATSSLVSAQSIPSRASFFVGQGPDTTYLLVDFKDTTFDASSIWGYAYQAPKTGLDLLEAVDSLDPNLAFSYDTASFGIYLDDVAYHRHLGEGGMPNFWSTWDALRYDSLAANTGLADTLLPGGLWGLSYTDFNPALAPDTPRAAIDPRAYQTSDVSTWLGSGPDSALVVLDFKNGSDTVSYGWGYRFSDSVAVTAALSAIESAINGLTLSYSGGRLTKASYQGLNASAGSGQTWLSWQASNPGNWQPRASTHLKAGHWQGFTFTDTAWQDLPEPRPGTPASAKSDIGLQDFPSPTAGAFYPVPASRHLHSRAPLKTVKLINAAGQVVKTARSMPLSVAELPAGLYWAEGLNQSWQLHRQAILIQP
jgi:hypothetical protein